MADRDRSFETVLAGRTVVADISGALYIPDEKMLVVADLHFGKGMRLAAGGALVPPYDTRATLHRLADVIRAYAPQTTVGLGDSFDDRDAFDRLSDIDRDHFLSVTQSTDWIWISGNHDPDPPAGSGGRTMEELRLANLTLRHEAAGGETGGEVSGHFHPKARVQVRGKSQVRRCFVTDGTRAILPAFGAYTGGLSVSDIAISRLFGRSFDTLVLGDARIHRIPRARLS